MFRNVVLCSILVTGLGYSSIVFAQTTPPSEQIIQPIIVNGQQVQGVMVIHNGAIQTFTCTSPKPYTTNNQTLSGWACFDPTSGAWLLHSQPPQQATYGYQPPSVYVEPPPIPYYSYYAYPYSYYPYGYYPFGYYSSSRFIVGPRFGFSEAPSPADLSPLDLWCEAPSLGDQSRHLDHSSSGSPQPAHNLSVARGLSLGLERERPAGSLVVESGEDGDKFSVRTAIGGHTLTRNPCGTGRVLSNHLPSMALTTSYFEFTNR